ncbi:MAG: Bax inhibitor-1 family protein [Verrucomicrobiales bacterium]|nr:Bax inhibitor-1 family protein [Verrucomicrobiales bacterium]
MSSAYGNPYSVAQADVSERAAFIRRTYAHLAGAVLALICIDFVLLNTPAVRSFIENIFFRGSSGGSMLWLGVLGAFMVISWLATSFANNPGNKNMQYLGLGLYTFAWAVMFLPILMLAQYKTGDNTLITKAGICTGTVFAALTMIAMFTRADFSFLRGFLMIGGFVALGAIIAGVLFGFSLGVWFSAAMVLFASISILYNTSEIIHNYNTDQHVAAALSLFGSVAMLFWYILRIFMSRE